MKHLPGAGSNAGDDFADGRQDSGDGGGAAGDGRHHHEIHEDEGGGFHSKHTHPDGHEEHEDHATYDDAVNWQHERFGHEEPDGDEGEPEDDGGEAAVDGEDIAGTYGRHGR